ncbi:HAD family hydrolase [Saliterribacillus persicus]|uniref:Putative hydrolase of the HAD superfamily n=1 Tax=Saliterribacillus persicus TaxID=930114 RepID=A0A368Y9J8_9BACI|nr:HAD-IA family hydrolase [Saliterribacillus persicus]RCW76785.1 putative hydrolase of the HAD superfamily [Saliterribacillus persicus]
MIFFDIDGTLLDHEEAEKMAAIDFYKAFGQELEYSEAEFGEIWYNLSIKYFEKFLTKELSFQDQRRMRMKDMFGHQLSNEHADSKFKSYLNLYKRNWGPYDDVITCLEQLKQLGHRLGIISNGDYKQQLEKLVSLGIHNFFDCIFTSSEIGVSKPNLIIFQKACKEANVQVHKSYYIGDRLETDALGSKEAGMIGIWLNRKNNATHQDIKVIHNLEELVPILN